MSFEFDLIGDDDDRPRPFSLNESAMLRLRQLMNDRDLLDYDFERGPWPDGSGPEHEVALAKFREAHADNAKVPHYKFKTNDHWVLTPTECRALHWGLIDYKNYEDPWWERRVQQFALRCALAADRAGLEVY